MRHTGWMRWQGDRTGLGQYEAVARKVLGQLDERLKLGNVAVGSQRVTLPDGAVVEATRIGGQPMVRVTPPPAPGARGRGVSLVAQALQGIVTKPRKFGTEAGVDDGQNAFGQHAHVILQHTDNPDDPGGLLWHPSFYDAEYKPDGMDAGIFSTSPSGPLFKDGLAAHGNVDWRDADEEIAITWLGHPSRCWLATTDYFDSDGTTTGESGPPLLNRGATRIYHNGRCVLDHDVIYTDWEDVDYREVISGACMRGATLIYVATPGRSMGVGTEFPIRVYKVTLTPDLTSLPWLAAAVSQMKPEHAALFVQATMEDVELIGEQVFPRMGADDGYGLATAFFNQSATQARGILTKRKATTGDTIGFVEVVIDISEDASEASFSVIDRGELAYIATETKTYEQLSPNVQNNTIRFVSDPDFPPPIDGTPPPAGTITSEAEIRWDISVQPSVLWTGGSITSEREPVSSGPFPVSVDFENDVPVYLWWEPEAQSESEAWTGAISETEEGSRVHTVTYDGSSNEPTNDSYEGYVERHIAVSRESTFSASVVGGKLYAIDANGARWFEVSTDRDGIHTDSISATLNKRFSVYAGPGIERDTTFNVAFGNSGDPLLPIVFPVLWWADLRSRSAVYSVVNWLAGTIRDYNDIVGVTAGGSEGTRNINDSMAWDYAACYRDEAYTETSINLAVTNTFICFYGEQEREMVATFDRGLEPELVSNTLSSGVKFDYVFGKVFNDTKYTLSGPDAAAIASGWMPSGEPPYDNPVDTTETASLPSEVSTQDPDRISPANFRDHVPGRLWAYSSLLPATFFGDFPGVIDREPASGASDFFPRYSTQYGAWIAYRGAWAYSMWNMDRTDDPGISYSSEIKGGDIGPLTGDRTGVQLYEQMWPLSFCVGKVTSIPK